jgi:hypothetical protein
VPSFPASDLANGDAEIRWGARLLLLMPSWQGPLDILAPKTGAVEMQRLHPRKKRLSHAAQVQIHGVPALAPGTGRLHSSLERAPLIQAPSLALPSQPTRDRRSLPQCCFGQERAAQPRQGAFPDCPAPSPSTPPDSPNFGLSSAQVTLIPPARAPFSPLSRLDSLTHPLASCNTHFHCL